MIYFLKNIFELNEDYFQVFGHISGAHLNPAVTICAVILEVIEPKMLFVYIPAQVLGATMGFGILKVLFSQVAWNL